MDKFSKNFKGDKIIWMVILLLSLISLLAVYSSTGSLAYQKQQGNTMYYMLKHGMILLTSLGIVYFVHLIPYKRFSAYSQLILLIAIPLLGFTLVLGTSINSAARWLTVPGVGLTVQTSDIAKLALILYLARQLSRKQSVLGSFKEGFLPMIAPVVIVAGLILPANFSTAALILVISTLLMFIGRVKLTFLFGTGLAFAVFVALFILIASSGEKTNRVDTWKSRIENFKSGDSEGNYQVEQAKIAIASGGIKGKGPGKSTQRNFLPQAYSDFIYAIILEEYGLLGGLAVLLLYLYLLYRAIVIVQQSSKTFPAFVAVGLTVSLVLQAMINMAVAVNLLPVTGQTLPLVSMGGSSLFFTSISFGIILSASWGTLPIAEPEVSNEPENMEHATASA